VRRPSSDPAAERASAAHGGDGMRRRLALILVALLVATLAALVLPAASLASPSISVARAQAHQLQGQVDSLNNRMEIVVERYDAAVQKLAALKASVATSQAQLLRARYALALAHQQLAEQVVIMYKQPTTQYLDVALSVHSFSDLATQLPFFDKLGQQSAATVREIDALKAPSNCATLSL